MRKRFNWPLFLVLAKKLLGGAKGSTSEEADLRSSISRSYYGVFHIGKHFVHDKWNESVSNRKNAHLELPEIFEKKGEYEIAKKLKKLRVARNQADYDEYVPDLEGLAQEMFNLAQEIIQDLGNL